MSIVPLAGAAIGANYLANHGAGLPPWFVIIYSVITITGCLYILYLLINMLIREMREK